MQTTTKVQSIEAKPKRTFRQYGGLVLRGMCMGASDIVPGVSGGTMAFILGIYEELVHSIRAVGQPEFIRAAVKFRIKELFQILNWQFLLSIITGILISIVALSSLLEWLLVNQPVYLWSFFFGLVLSSVFVVSKRIKQWNPLLIANLIIGAVAAFVLVGLVPLQTPDAWWFLILSGAVASCALILPGVSGAFLLVLLGKYQFVLRSLNDLRNGEISQAVPLILVAIGAAIGLVSFAQFLGWLFKQYHDLTVAMLIGLMLGSLRKIWPWKLDLDWLRDTTGNFILDSDGHRIAIAQANIWPDFATGSGLTQFAVALVLALIGISAILLIDRLAGSFKK